MRGELGLAREAAESFLHDAENEGRMTEAAVARRNLGGARLLPGRFTTHAPEARRGAEDL